MLSERTQDPSSFGGRIPADAIAMAPDKDRLIMRNPQIVNGAQTVTALFEAFDRTDRRDSSAEVLVRVYRLPYERTETYEQGIEIIKALNSQNPIRPSDLHSTDPRQVRIEDLLTSLGYRYLRKRGKEAKSGRHAITMRNLALYYLVCKDYAPHEGVFGQIEEIFGEKSKYDSIFPEEAISRELNSVSHIVLSYVLAWRLAEVLEKVEKDLPKYARELSDYTFYFVLADMHHKLGGWRVTGFKMGGWHNWWEFIESDEFENGLWQYAEKVFKIASRLPHEDVEPRKFYRTKDATQRFEQRAPSVRAFNTFAARTYDNFGRARIQTD